MHMITYSKLTESQKKEYKKFCDKKYGETIIVSSERGEPLYVNVQGEIIDTFEILDLLFSYSYN